MLKKYTFLYLLTFAMLSFVACKKVSTSGNTTDNSSSNQAKPQTQIDYELIQKYIADNGLKANTTKSGIHYVIREQGAGNNPTIASTVKVNYTGTLLDGTEFDKNSGIEFPLSRVVQGWQEGIPLFKPGGKGTLLLPSHLAYGANSPSPKIPPNSVLVFDIELLEVK